MQNARAGAGQNLFRFQMHHVHVVLAAGGQWVVHLHAAGRFGNGHVRGAALGVFQVLGRFLLLSNAALQTLQQQRLVFHHVELFFTIVAVVAVLLFSSAIRCNKVEAASRCDETVLIAEPTCTDGARNADDDPTITAAMAIIGVAPRQRLLHLMVLLSFFPFSSHLPQVPQV